MVSWDGKKGSKTLGVEKRLECRFQLKGPTRHLWPVTSSHKKNYLEMGMARTVKWTQLFPFVVVVVVNLVLVIAFRLILLVGNSFATKGKGTFLFFSTARYTYC